MPNEDRRQKPSKPRFSIFSRLMQRDWFSVPMPGFNYRGETAIATRLGTSLTFISSVVVLIYAISKFTHLQTVRGSTITSFEQETANLQNDSFNMQQRNFRIAFAFEGVFDQEFKNDPKFLRSIIRLEGTRKGELYERVLPHRECTAEDYASFHPIRANQRQLLEQIQGSEKRGFLCIDWPAADPYVIFGEQVNDDITSLEFIMAPCNYRHN